MQNLAKDFINFAKDKKLFSAEAENIVNNTTLTPVILEERKLNVASMDIFSRLLYDRIIYFGNEFNSETCNLLIAQLLYLDSIDNRDINIYINSPGGSVIDGLGVIDTMNFISSKVSTTCIGEAASMGAVLLSAGEKEKRFALPHSRMMIHQISSQMKGTFKDIEIEMKQMERCKVDVYKILAENMNKSLDEIEMLCDRNNWFIGEEGIEIGLIDKILKK